VPNPEKPRAAGNRILVKLRPSTALRAAESRANLRPLYEPPKGAPQALGIATEAQWFLADLPGGAASPWDLAHDRVADQLGVAESDVVFAEPDLVHDIYLDPRGPEAARGLGAVGEQCQEEPQDPSNGKATGADDGWHLGDDFAELARARDAVPFTAPRTRIAHVDTGYFPAHVTLPRNVRHDLERNFVDGDPSSAVDPDNWALVLDNSGHGTGTLSILAGKEVPFLGGKPLGGAPDADIVPLRIADSVALFATSAFAQALHYAVDISCDVLSMSMGGLPSQAWREAVDRAYLAGLCMVTAAGNNKGGLPTRHVVYPARYGRVIAAAGVMANRKAYARLDNFEMEGNYGPDKVMRHALAAFTPNIPWAVFGCPAVTRRNGAGTSSATPQIAAAAALWLEKYKSVLPRDWHRVEAVRHALFSAAVRDDFERLGNGMLRAFRALDVAPDLTLRQTKSDSDSFAFFRVITGLGLLEVPPRERMLNIELEQRWLVNTDLQRLVPDPDDVSELEKGQLIAFMEAVIADPHASAALRKHVAARYGVVAEKPVPGGVAAQAKDVLPEVLRACDPSPAARMPAHRKLRVYALDPSFSTRLETSAVNEVTVPVRWEALEAGPVGEYLAVTDTDPTGQSYDPVELDDPRLLAQDGWAPSEGNAQFHQQMVYAVAMKTIEHFERALGRPVLWRPGRDPRGEEKDGTFVRQLAVHPHALRQGNAYYSPEQIALRFGYFETPGALSGEHMPGSRVYACLSHDIIAHETTHAILDGMHRRFSEPTNVDMLALHEGFADIVALMQHFTVPQILALEIGRTRGNLEAESLLGSLAVQFGWAVGGRGALREAIGHMKDGAWVRLTPDPAELPRRLTPHARGAILVAAVFDAFLAIYKTRTRDLLRLSTGGTGVLAAGDIHPDLVRQLSAEAGTSASHMLNMCIRALDYLPPVDVTFFDYLRALITADSDLVPDDRYNYRVAFVEAFRRRGIYPLDVGVPDAQTIRTLSVDTLRWQGLDFSILSPDKVRALGKHYAGMIGQLKRYADTCLYLEDRKRLFDVTRVERIRLHAKLKKVLEVVPDFAADLGLDDPQSFEVHHLHAAMHTTPDGRRVPLIVVALTQTTPVPADPAAGVPAHTLRSGSTLIIDLAAEEVKYRIFKRFNSPDRRARTAAFVRDAAADPLRALLFAPRAEPFAALHFLGDAGL
jgi:hypothetical protein